jgi:hypothetical protein
MGLTKHFYMSEGILSAIPAEYCSNGILVQSVYGARTKNAELNVFHMCTGNFNMKRGNQGGMNWHRYFGNMAL